MHEPLRSTPVAKWCFTPDPVTYAAAELVNELSSARKASGGRVTFVVSGGQTPKAVLPGLLANSLDWHAIDVIAGDERLVPQGHPDSTEEMIRRQFKQANKPLNYHSFGDDLMPERALERWRAEWVKLSHAPIVAFLGLGPDGHTCSLFPNRPEAGDPQLIAAAVPLTPPHPHARLTLGPAALARMDKIILVSLGLEKCRVLREARSLSAEPRRLPVAWIAQRPETTIFADCPAEFHPMQKEKAD